MQITIRSCLALLFAFAMNSARGASFEVVYDEMRDQACGTSRSYVIKDAWVLELKELLPGFRSMWQEQAPAMFDALSTMTKRQTESFVKPINLVLCDTPSQSFGGPSVNMRFALKSFTQQPVSIRYKIDVAFHESLHLYVSQYVPRNSALLSQHRRESFCVLNHLHLLALQKAVLLSLGDTVSLEQVIANDSMLPSGCYKRAWSIINDSSESYKPYLAELE